MDRMHVNYSMAEKWFNQKEIIYAGGLTLSEKFHLCLLRRGDDYMVIRRDIRTNETSYLYRGPSLYNATIVFNNNA